MKTKYPYARGFTLVELLVVIAIIAALAGIGVPVILKQQKKSAVAEALSNSKEIGMAMMNFDGDYGSFPSDATAKTVRDNTNTALNLGSASSNDYFRQLIAASYIDSEKIFYAKTLYTHKPDNVLTGAKCLENGEVGFGYIMASASEAQSSSGNSSRPLLITPLLNAGADGQCELDTYDKKAIVFRLDHSAESVTVRPSDKQAMLGGGKTLLQTGEDSVWGTDVTPIIKPPLKSGG
jgi:prepilin-type N-terminal cleavage/methylation domain-containing protein